MKIQRVFLIIYYDGGNENKLEVVKIAQMIMSSKSGNIIT